MAKSKLTEELITRFGEEIESGLPIIYTCDLLGIHNSSYSEWMVQGDKDCKEGLETLHAKLWTTVKKAYATFIKNAKAEMKARTNGWQSIAWWLERTNPFFMPKQQVQADEEGKVTVVIGGKELNPRKPR